MPALNLKYLFIPLYILGTAYVLTACEKNEGPFEEAGENVDQAVEEAGDKVEDATD